MNQTRVGEWDHHDWQLKSRQKRALQVMGMMKIRPVFLSLFQVLLEPDMSLKILTPSLCLDCR